MKRYAADIPACVTVYFAAKDDADARAKLKRLETTPHEFGDEHQLCGGGDDFKISPAITLYPQGIETTRESPSILMDDDTDDDDTCRECGDFYEDGGDGFDGMCPTCADKAELDHCETCEESVETRTVPCDECGSLDA